MRPIRNTITEYPGEPGGGKESNRKWIRSGETVEFWTPHTDPEVRKNILLVVEDVLKADSEQTTVNEDGGYSVVSRYTLPIGHLHEALNNVGQHHSTYVAWRVV